MPETSDNNRHSTPKRHVPQRVVCVETGEVYDGAEAAARALGIAYGGSNIRTAARNGGMVKGYHWRFEGDGDAKPGEVRGNRAVVCWETGEQFETADAAAEWAGCTPRAVYAAVRLRNTAGGRHWYLAGSPRPDASALKFSKKVVCWETGEVFPSAKAAAESLGEGVARVRDAIKRGSVAGGLHWRYEGESAAAIEGAMAGESKPHSSSRAASRPKRGVTCWETGESFDSADAAGTAVGVKGRAIAHAVNNRSRSGGFHWYWSDGPRPAGFEKPERAGNLRPRRAVACWETGEVYRSAEEAVAAVGVKNPSSVFNAIRRGGTCGGFHWHWADEPRPDGFAPRRRGSGGGRNKRAVVCWETGEVYPSAREAAEATGLREPSSICTAAKSRRTAGGFHWYYRDEDRPREEELAKPKSPRPRAIACVETGEVYSSARAAARAVGIQSGTGIARAASSGEAAKGFHWHWADEPRPKAAELRPGKSPRRPVACWETGEVFESSAVAAATAGVHPANITEAIRKGFSSGGYHWHWADEPRPSASELRFGRGAKRAVACWETGEVFEDAKAAAAAAGTTPSLVARAVKRRTASGGLHWYWADEPRPDASELKGRRKRKGELRDAAEKDAAETAEVASEADDRREESQIPPVDVAPEFGNCARWSVLFSDVTGGFNRRCGELAGLNATQARLLLGFSLLPDTPVGRVADMLAIKRNTAGSALAELEGKGLVVPVESRRGNPVELTAEGRRQLPVYLEALSGAFCERVGHLPELRRGELLALMAREGSAWRDALKAWVEAQVEEPGSDVALGGEDRVETGSAVSASLAFESMWALSMLERGHARSLVVPPSEMRALHLLAACGRPMKTTELCERAGLDGDSASAAFPALMRKGLVACSKRERDRRVTDVSLSDAGRELVEQTADGYVKLFEAMFPGMSSVSPESFGIER